MPLLVRLTDSLTDSKVEAVDGVVAQTSNGLEDVRRMLEEVSTAGLSIHEESLLPDLHIKPVHRDIQLGYQLRGGKRTGVMGPPAVRFADLDAGGRAGSAAR